MFNKYLNNQKNQLTLLVLVTFLCYINVTQNGYSLDDHFVTTAEHPLVSKGLSGIKDIFTSNYSTYQGKGFEYRPLTVFLYAIEYQLFGFNPALSHFINLLLYLFLLVQVYFVLQKLLPLKNEEIFWIILVFALHPLHNEVVVSLKNREEILVAIFGFLSFKYLFTYLQNSNTKALIASFVFFLVGSFAKVTISPFAFLIVFSAWYFKKGSFKKLTAVFFTYFLISQLFYWTAYAFLSNGLTRTFDVIENPLVEISFLNRIPTAFSVLFFYVKLFIWPNPLLSYYGLGSIQISNWYSPSFFAGLSILLLIAIIFIRELKKRSLFGYGIFIFTFLISTYLNFPVLAPGVIAERFMFTAVLGFAIILVTTLNKYLSPKYFYIVIITTTSIYVFLNITRTPNWKSLSSLLEADTNKEITSVKLVTAYAENYHSVAANETSDVNLRENYFRKAQEGYLKVINLYPKHGGAYNNLGTLYASIGKLKEAETCLLKAIELGFILADSYFNLAAIYEIAGKYNLAKKYYFKCLELNPDYVQAKERLTILKNY